MLQQTIGAAQTEQATARALLRRVMCDEFIGQIEVEIGELHAWGIPFMGEKRPASVPEHVAKTKSAAASPRPALPLSIGLRGRKFGASSPIAPKDFAVIMPALPRCRSGEIGRRAGLKIRC